MSPGYLDPHSTVTYEVKKICTREIRPSIANTPGAYIAEDPDTLLSQAVWLDILV